LPATELNMLFLATISVLIVFGAIAIIIRPKLAARQWERRTLHLSPTELAAEARQCAVASGIKKHFPDASLFNNQQSWDKASLRTALGELYGRLDAEDRRNAASGPGSWVFYYYDFGIASVREALDKIPDQKV
jgi:hypothetical protein